MKLTNLPKLLFVFNFCINVSYSIETPSDLHFDKQWGLLNKEQKVLRWDTKLKRDFIAGKKGIDINWAPFKSTSNKHVVVAILDHGLDTNHPDLKGKIWTNPLCKDNENAQVPCHGYNFLDQTTDITDELGHGTQLAGIITANLDGLGTVGVAPHNIKLMPLKVLNQELQGINSAIYKGRYLPDYWADAIRFAVENGADVINMSMGWPKFLETPKVKKAVSVALENNVTFVVAPGNNGKEIQTFPCSYTGVICVGAVDNTGEIPEYSNFGSKVDILAPGDSIVTTIPQNAHSEKLRIPHYDSVKGTSFAAPFVTGVIASLKVKFPGISNDEIAARVYGNAQDLSHSNERFTKYGLVNMKGALNSKVDSFVAPLYKDLYEIPVQEDGQFSFTLPIKSYLSEVQNITVEIQSLSDDLSFQKSQEVLPVVAASETKRVFLEGTIHNLQSDYRKVARIIIKDKNGKTLSNTRTALYFAKNVTQASKSIDIPITGNLDPRLMAFFRGEMKSSRLRMVSDRYAQSNGPEYYVRDPKKQSDTETVIEFISPANDIMKIHSVKIPKVQSVLAIFRNDIDLDGSIDYIIYSLHDDEKGPLTFTFLDAKKRPLFGKKSHWTFPITTFEGVPLKDEGEIETFNWMQVQTPEFGKILVPAIYKNWKLPDQDDSDSILDTSGPLDDEQFSGYKTDNHLYYLLPKVDGNQVEFVVRAFDNYNFYDQIRNGDFAHLGVYASYKEFVQLQAPMSQDTSALRSGKNYALLSIGSEFERRYFLVTIFDNKIFKIRPYPMEGFSYLAFNNVFPLLNTSGQGISSNKSAMVVNLERNLVRIKILDPERLQGLAPYKLQSPSWGDPILNYIAGHDDALHSSFIESRFFLYAIDKNGLSGRLPLNRDTSFPPLDFSDMLRPLVVTGSSGESLPAIHIDSSLISHEHVYTMVKNDNTFYRPISLSLKVPKNCAVEKPKRWGDQKQFHHVFLCRNQKGLYFKILPMQLD